MNRVCHLTSVHRTTDVRIFHKQCTSLAKAGYETYLVGPGQSRSENGVNVIGVGEATGGRLSRMTRFANKVYKVALAIDADIYHFHDPELLPYGLRLKKKGKTVIFDAHEIYPEQILSKTYLGIFRGLISSVFSIYEKYVVAKLDAVAVVTPHMIDIYKPVQENTHLVTNYPIVEEALSIDFSKKKQRVSFAGGISRQWNHRNVIEAISGISGLSYVLCGPVQSNEYLEVLESTPGWEKVNYLGRVDYDQAQKVLRESLIGVALLSPSGNTNGKEGTLGNTKLFEMMQAGLPVICTDFALWREIIDKYECGICVDPADVDAIRDAIQYLVDNPQMAKKMGENGINAVRSEFNWHEQVKNLQAMYP